MTHRPKMLAQHCCAQYRSTNSRKTCTNAGDLQQFRAGPQEKRRHSTNGMLSPIDYEHACAQQWAIEHPGKGAA
jgi:hypothetical protein